jgi:hypothetical protein
MDVSPLEDTPQHKQIYLLGGRGENQREGDNILSIVHPLSPIILLIKNPHP